MSDFFFISYSSVDGADFAIELADELAFTGSFDSAVARLRKHLAWMDSPRGQLQALKYRLSDAQRELPRAEPEQQARIREDIAEFSGRWHFDSSRGLLQLEVSGGVSEGVESMAIQIDRWEDDDTALCTFDRRKGRLKRLVG